jgi:hypothetical protein
LVKSKNASYISPQIQNELIAMCGDEIRDEIVQEVKNASFYSLLVDETADIAGKEQLYMGFRYHNENTNVIKEEFAGFSLLEAQDEATIARKIETFLNNNRLDPEKCGGLGVDGCSTMVGKEGGVQAILRKKI